MAGTPLRTPADTVPQFRDAERAVPELQCLTDNRLGSGGFNFLRSFGSETVFAIVGDRPIDDRSTIDALPSIEHQKEIREALQHHQAFAFRTTHDYFLPQVKVDVCLGG